MLKELNTINFKQLKNLKVLLKKININKYEKIYLLPFNAYYNFLYKELKTNKTYFIDSYLKNNNQLIVQ